MTVTDLQFQQIVIGGALALSCYVIYRDEASKERPNVVITSLAFALGLFAILYAFGFGESLLHSLGRSIHG